MGSSSSSHSLPPAKYTALVATVSFLAGYTLPKIIEYLLPTKRQSTAVDTEVKEEKKSRPRRSKMANAASTRGDWSGKALKLMLCVRTDLEMGKGKIAAQCGHAVSGIMQDLLYYDQDLLQQWIDNGQPKIAVKVRTEEALMQLEKDAIAKDLPTCMIRDAGRTQIAPNSKTVLAIGPGPKDLVNKVTGSLKLL
mmetsp:Transcript_5911/g.9816  ORF Transcript_5911/g.9816 Transcript_5911/m.9816 type:complete len:194 (-) Transcript_5911:44-625(-)|eukprot:jgi/Bigna1/51264/estExt_Genewise1.C_1280012